MIVETTDNRFFLVEDFAEPELAHVWKGRPLKHTKKHGFVVKDERPQLVSKAHCHRIVVEG